MIEAYFDGCCEPRNPGGHGGYGVVIQKNGEKIHQESGYCGTGQNMTNNVAEYEGLLAILRWLLNNGKSAEEIMVYGDSQLAIRQMRLEFKIKRGAYAPKAFEAMKLKLQFPKINFEWIPREQNTEADCLSKIGASQRN